jgi:hypothetical protein
MYKVFLSSLNQLNELLRDPELMRLLGEKGIQYLSER